jgi:hypothetical protein
VLADPVVKDVYLGSREEDDALPASSERGQP